LQHSEFGEKSISVGTKRTSLEQLRKVLGLDSVKDAAGKIIHEAPTRVGESTSEALNTAISQISEAHGTSSNQSQRNTSMNKINIPLAADLMSVISANAMELSCQNCTTHLEQKTIRHEPFVIQRLYPAARVKSDCEKAIQMAAQRDEAALDKMIEQDRVTFFAVGTRVYPVKSTDMGTWWLVREKGSTEKWWISVRAFSQD
jgi:hypothetical protein